jgi:hypothetical protein
MDIFTDGQDWPALARHAAQIPSSLAAILPFRLAKRRAE